MEEKKTKDKRTILRRTGKILLWTAGIWAVLIGIIQTAVSEKSLRYIVSSFTDEYVDGKVDFGKIHLSMFSHFPNAWLTLEDVSLTYPSDRFMAVRNDGMARKLGTQGQGEEQDTLAAFKGFSVSLNLPALIIGRIKVPAARLEKPRVFLHRYADGSSNWDMFSLSEGEEEDSTETSIPDIVVGNTSLTGRPHIVYTDSKDTLTAVLNLRNAELEGKVCTRRASSEDFRMRVDSLFIAGRTGTDSLAFLLNHIDLDKKDRTIGLSAKAYTALATGSHGRMGIPVSMQGEAELLRDSIPAVAIRRFKADAAGFPLALEGQARLHEDRLELRMAGDVDSFHLGNFLKKYGKNFIDASDDISTDAALKLHADIDGDYIFSTGQLPVMKITAEIPSSGISHRKLDRNLSLRLLAEASADSTGRVDARLRKLQAEGSGVSIDLKAGVRNLMGKDPLFDIDLKSSAIVDSLLWLLPEHSDIIAEGGISADLDGKIRMSQMNLYRFTESGLKGRISSDRLRFQSDSLKANVFVDSLDLRLGTMKPEEDAPADQEKLMEIKASIDSADVIYGPGLVANAVNAEMTVQNSAALLKGKDSLDVHPVQGLFKADRLRLKDADSTILIIANTSNRFRIRKKEGSEYTPEIRMSSWTRDFAYKDKLNRARISGLGLDMTGAMNSIERKIRMKKLQDSLANVYAGVPKDSLVQMLFQSIIAGSINAASAGYETWQLNKDFGNQDPDFTLSGSMAKVFREWDIEGNFKMNRAVALTPLFPVRNEISGFKGRFNNNTVNLDQLSLNSGASELEITGELTNLKKALLRKGTVQLKLDINSPQLDVDELIGAWYVGQNFQKDAGHKQLDMEDEQYEEKVITDSLAYVDPEMSAIIVPANINADINLEANGITYSNLTIDWLSTRIRMKDRCLQMKDFIANSNMGDIRMDAFYSTTSKKKLKAGFDLDLVNITAGDVISLMPAVDSLMPSLKSFEGMLNCEFAVTTDLDTNMNLIIPTTAGVVRIGGEDLSIKDSPEFRKLAKTFLMKNKDEAHIQSMKVEAILHDCILDIFPFKLEMDRYRLAMSGRQHMDLSFNYHISVLKSPVPFRLGVNLIGDNFDKMKIKLGKAKYKSADIPSYSGLIDNLKVNLVSSIRNIFERGVNRVIQENEKQIVHNLSKQEGSIGQPEAPEFQLESQTNNDILKKQ